MSVGDPIRLTRRDRAALTLALAMLRADDGVSGAYMALELGRETAAIVGAIDALDLARPTVFEHPTFRARLALCIRALLRADAGDYGATWTDLQCRYCGRIEQFDQPSTMVCDPSWPPRAGACRGILEMRRTSRVRPFTPLWELAGPKPSASDTRAREP